MSTITRLQLWQRLQQQALVEGDMPAADAHASPWYVRVMLGIAGWIGAMFLMSFVGIAFSVVMQSAAAALMVGALCCVGAFAIFRAARNNDFVQQFGLAVSLTGQGLFIFGLFDGFKSDTVTTYFLIAVFEAVLALLMPNFIHRVLSTAGAAAALSLALNRLGIYEVATGIAAAGLAMVWLNEQRWAANGSLWRPVGYGLALALLLIESTQLLDRSVLHWLSSHAIGWWMLYGHGIGTALVAVVFLWTVLRILQHEGIAVAGKIGLPAVLAAILVGVVSYFAPGIATALLILLLGFASGNRVLIGLGLFGLLGFVSHYYYQLQATLLFKSMVLAASGATLLIARLVLHQLSPLTAEEEHHA